jgi:hypothetical protein
MQQNTFYLTYIAGILQLGAARLEEFLSTLPSGLRWIAGWNCSTTLKLPLVVTVSPKLRKNSSKHLISCPKSNSPVIWISCQEMELVWNSRYKRCYQSPGYAYRGDPSQSIHLTTSYLHHTSSDPKPYDQQSTGSWRSQP